MCFIDIALILDTSKSLCCAFSHMQKVTNSGHMHMGKCTNFCL